MATRVGFKVLWSIRMTGGSIGKVLGSDQELPRKLGNRSKSLGDRSKSLGSS